MTSANIPDSRRLQAEDISYDLFGVDSQVTERETYVSQSGRARLFPRRWGDASAIMRLLRKLRLSKVSVSIEVLDDAGNLQGRLGAGERK